MSYPHLSSTCTGKRLYTECAKREQHVLGRHKSIAAFGLLLPGRGEPPEPSEARGERVVLELGGGAPELGPQGLAEVSEHAAELPDHDLDKC